MIVRGPDDWAKFRKSGNPTNDNGYGGHADAADKDRHLGHVPIIYDMLRPYILTKGAIGDDNAGISESGNGIPDIIDEARYEVDFWLRLRDGKEYAVAAPSPAVRTRGAHGWFSWRSRWRRCFVLGGRALIGHADLTCFFVL